MNQQDELGNAQDRHCIVCGSAMTKPPRLTFRVDGVTRTVCQECTTRFAPTLMVARSEPATA